jgi:hypothetical protein
VLEPTALARDVLARAPRPIPRYADPAWHALPESDLRRVAAVLVAAECWRSHTTLEQITADLLEQLAADDALVRARLVAAAVDVRDALPSISPESWWDRVAAATVLARDMARKHYDEHTAHNARQRGTLL